MKLVDRFKPDTLVRCIAEQELIAGAQAASQALADVIDVVRQLETGDCLIREGDCDDALYLILHGRFRVNVKADLVGYRGKGTHVGEMAIVMTGLRTATLTAVESSVVAQLRASDFRVVANAYPMIWENIARVLARRLDERKRFIKDPNPRPYVFIGSSGEQEDVAFAIKAGLHCPDIDCEVWKEPETFPPGDSFLDTLIYKARKADYAILVFGKDDKTISRGTKRFSPRDNVVFEAGLFMGSLGKKRTFVITDRQAKLKMLSDFDGISLLSFTKKKPWFKPVEITVAASCGIISKIITEDRVK
jgi:CRP/FNR family cyclic AMP-dependent transcriptional regulator